MSSQKFKHPTQPIDVVDGVRRFRKNAIVRWLADTGRLNLNETALLPGVSDEDRQQIAQLLGYSLSGYGDLSYVDDTAWGRVESEDGERGQATATSIPTAKEKRARLTDIPESVAHALLVRVATAIREWTSGPLLVVEISRDEYEHADPVVAHLRSLGYLVTLIRAPRDRLGSPCLVVEVATHGLFDDGGADDE